MISDYVTLYFGMKIQSQDMTDRFIVTINVNKNDLSIYQMKGWIIMIWQNIEGRGVTLMRGTHMRGTKQGGNAVCSMRVGGGGGGGATPLNLWYRLFSLQ